jgi:hypothetical protein
MKVGFPKRRTFSVNTCAPSGSVIRACGEITFPQAYKDRGFFLHIVING